MRQVPVEVEDLVVHRDNGGLLVSMGSVDQPEGLEAGGEAEPGRATDPELLVDLGGRVVEVVPLARSQAAEDEDLAIAAGEGRLGDEVSGVVRAHPLHSRERHRGSIRAVLRCRSCKNSSREGNTSGRLERPPACEPAKVSRSPGVSLLVRAARPLQISEGEITGTRFFPKTVPRFCETTVVGATPCSYARGFGRLDSDQKKFLKVVTG